MTPEQAEKIRHAAEVLSAYSRGDRGPIHHLAEGTRQKTFDATVALTDGLVLLAVESAQTLAQVRRSTVPAALNGLRQRDEQVIPGATSRWGEALQAVKDIHAGRTPQATSSLVDALASSFDVALALVAELARRAGSSPEWYCDQIAAAIPDPR